MLAAPQGGGQSELNDTGSSYPTVKKHIRHRVVQYTDL